MAGYALVQLLTICQNSAAIAVAKLPGGVLIPSQPECLGVRCFGLFRSFGFVTAGTDMSKN